MAHGYPDFEGDKSGLYLIPEWAAKEGKDVTLKIPYTNAIAYEAKLVTHNVPADKTFYVTHLSGVSYAALTTNADLQHAIAVDIGGDVSGTLWMGGGNSGLSATFPKPIVIKGGELFTGSIRNTSTHLCSVALSISGYEV